MTQNDAIAQALTLLAKNLAQNRNPEPDPAGEMLKKLAQVKPPIFEGGVDPAMLENWIREFEKIFTALKCPEDLKVDQAALYLKDDADLWWKENGTKLQAATNFNWGTFTTALRDKFYPPFLKKQKAQEFINLKMNKMTIDEYYKKFTSLARFAPEVVATDVLKAQRFEQGLSDELQLLLGGETFTDLDTVYGRAAHLYGLQERLGKHNSNAGEKRKDFGGSSDHENFKKPKNGNSSGKGDYSSGGSLKPRDNTDRHYYCKWCKNDHPGTDCKGNLVNCRFCQKKGHREYECLAKKRQEANNSSNHGGPTQTGDEGVKPNGNYKLETDGSNPGRLSVMSRREAERSADTFTGEEFSFGDF